VSTGRGHLVLFAREPVAGRVKTRLAAALGRGPAALLYAAFLEDLSGALGGPWESVVAHDGEVGPRLRAVFGNGWRFTPQGEGGLGDRMAGAAALALSEGAGRVVLAGSDAPTLTAREVGAAFDALATVDVVFAPSPDGGFSLVGLRPPADPAALFAGVAWSSARALGETRGNAERAGLSVALLPVVPDVDVAGDLVPLLEALRKESSLAPATRRALAEHHEVPVR
jgi:uncharacterized protein